MMEFTEEQMDIIRDYAVSYKKPLRDLMKMAALYVTGSIDEEAFQAYLDDKNRSVKNLPLEED